MHLGEQRWLEVEARRLVAEDEFESWELSRWSRWFRRRKGRLLLSRRASFRLMSADAYEVFLRSLSPSEAWIEIARVR